MKAERARQKSAEPTTYDVIVVGGGAAGLMAASVASEQGKRVLLLEKNRRLGEKVRISGGGRCNITNAEEDVRVLLKKYGDAEQQLYSAFTRYGVLETITYFESRGLPLVVEAQKRAFPKSQNASDVVRVLEESIKKGGVVVKTAAPVSEITAESGRITAVVAQGTAYTADTYILATGGVSHPETGSTGDGFGWLRTLGHTVQAPSPTIVPLATAEEWSHILAGSAREMKITFRMNEKKAFTVKGNILFTHFGLSGPTILNCAGRVSDLLQEGVVTAHLDCFPEFDEGALEKNILAIFDEEKNKMIKNIIKRIVPGMQPALLRYFDSINPDTKVHSITKDERKLLIKGLKSLPVTITGLMGFDRAVVADGGVPLDEIDMKTMRSRRITNLCITGDLLHIRRPSGGYSLQLCWTTGALAGMNA